MMLRKRSIAEEPASRSGRAARSATGSAAAAFRLTEAQERVLGEIASRHGARRIR